MKIRKRPADAVVGNRQLSARVLGLPYDRFWVETRMAAFAHEHSESRRLQTHTVIAANAPWSEMDTRNNRDFGDALIRAVFDEVSVGI